MQNQCQNDEPRAPRLFSLSPRSISYIMKPKGGGMERLSKEDLIALVQSVFPRFPEDCRMAVLVDIPRRPAADNEAWKARRRLAEEWVGLLKDGAEALGLERVDLIAYPD